MSNQETHTASRSIDANATPSEQEVADYLRRNPAFFEDKPTLLTDLRVPHTAGTAVSLVERQVAVLRDKNEKLQEQLDDLIKVAHENDKLNGLLHSFTLRVIESTSLDEVLSLISKQLHRDFSADLVAVRLLADIDPAQVSDSAVFPEDADAFCGLFRRLLTGGKPFCGQLASEQLQNLFGDLAESVASSAMMPLGVGGDLGLVVIGSYERDRYHAGVDTAFLKNLSEIISVALKKFVNAG